MKTKSKNKKYFHKPNTTYIFHFVDYVKLLLWKKMKKKIILSNPFFHFFYFVGSRPRQRNEKRKESQVKLSKRPIKVWANDHARPYLLPRIPSRKLSPRNFGTVKKVMPGPGRQKNPRKKRKRKKKRVNLRVLILIS